MWAVLYSGFWLVSGRTSPIGSVKDQWNLSIFLHFIYHIWRQCCMSKLSNLSIARSGIRTHASGSNLKLAPCTTRPYWIWYTVYLLGLFIRCSINGWHFKKFSQNKIWTCILGGWLQPERSALDHSATLTELQLSYNSTDNRI